MFLIKGLLIFSPLILCNFSFIRGFAERNKILIVTLLSVFLFITISPYSFIGWFLDYFLYYASLTLILSLWIEDPISKVLKVSLIIITIISISTFYIIGSLFLPTLYKEYSKYGLTYSIYKIPDMVMSPTFKLVVNQRWLLVEKKLYDERTTIDCKTFEYDVDNTELIIIDTCQAGKASDDLVQGIDSDLTGLFASLNIDRIKRDYGRGSTSAVLNIKDALFDVPPDNAAFLGEYFFVNNNPSANSPFIATAIITSNKNPLLFTDKNESLLEFSVYNSNIKVLKKLSVGQSLQSLFQEFGNPHAKVDSVIFYASHDNIILSVKVFDNKVVAYKVGKYKQINRTDLFHRIINNFKL